MERTVIQSYGKCPKLPWMIEFHSTADGKVFNNQLNAAFAPTYLEHLSRLHLKSKITKKRLTQFVGVIPPKPTFSKIETLMKSGMTVALLRMTYFSLEEMHHTIDLIRRVLVDFGHAVGRVFPLAIAIDITEPEVVIGKLLGPETEVQLEKGQITQITSNRDFEHCVSKDFIYVNSEELCKVIQPGDPIDIGDGSVNLSALEVARDIVRCIVDKAGALIDNLTVKLPNTPLTIPSETMQDKMLQLAKERLIDMIFVRPCSLKKAKDILEPTAFIIMKIENLSDCDHFDKDLEIVDAVCIDGDKLIATANETVFILQKSITARCNKAGKPVITVLNCNTMTKTVVCDIANAILDGIDSLVLPPDPDLIESISTLCKAAEAAIYQKQLFDTLAELIPPPLEPIYSLSLAAVETSFKVNASAIILITTSGRTAKMIASFRPRCPVIALTRFRRIASQLMVYRGIIPIFYVKAEETANAETLERAMQVGMTFAKLHGYVRMGDAVVIVFGIRHAVGFKNCMEVVFASEYDTVPVVKDY